MISLSRRGRGPLSAVLAILIVATAMSVARPEPARAEASAPTFRFDGGGYGHGVGMSQYGAKGQADAGRSAASILQTYYQGTSITQAATPARIRVGLLQAVAQVTVTSAGGLGGSDGSLEFRWGSGAVEVRTGETWQVRAVGSGWQLFKNGQAATGVFTGFLHLHFGSRGSLVRVSETGHRYRWGTMDLVHGAGATFDAVVDIGSYEAYLWGLGEVPSSWPLAALQAQAIAGRTYALDKARRLGDSRPGCSCTVYASVADQAYIGYEKEAAASGNRWVDAVNSSRGMAVLAGGVPIQAFYFSSSGGHSENSEFTFATALPYLRGVADPWDATPDNPNHRWSITYTQQQLSSALTNAGLGVGTVSSVATPPPHGVSGRVGRVIDHNQGGVTIVGSGGTRRVSGPQLSSALGLKSTSFRVAASSPAVPVVVPKHPNGAILHSPSSGAVWVMREGRRWPVANPDAYTSQASWSEITSVSDSVMSSYPAAGAGFREGSLLATPDGKVWVVSDGRRRHITNWSVFTGLGLNWSAVRSVPHVVAGVDPEGAPVTSPQRVPDGMFVKKADDPAIYLVDNGRARPLASSAAFASYRAGMHEVATISPTQMSTLGIGSPVGFRDGSLIATDRVWAIADGTRRWVASAQAFAALGYDWADVVAVPAQVAAVHPEGPALHGPPHPNGAIVRTGSGPTWVVKQGIREPIGPEALASRATPEEAVVTSDQVLAPLPTLALGWRDGTLLSDGAKVYLVSNGQRRHIANAHVFYALGLRWSNVRSYSPAQVAVHPEGPPITSGARLVDGMFVLPAGSSAIYQVTEGQARHVVSWDAFLSWRVRMDEVVRVGADKLPPFGPAVGFRDGSLIATDRVWAIADGTRRWVASGQAFAALGYDWADVVGVTAQVATVHPEGPAIS